MEVQMSNGNADKAAPPTPQAIAHVRKVQGSQSNQKKSQIVQQAKGILQGKKKGG
jgi:hypothetical protein